MATLAKNTIFTNVALTPEGGVWWEGMTDEPPAECLDWQGKQVDARRSPKKPAPKPPIPTPASPRPPRSAPPSIPLGKIPTACPSAPSSSAAAAPPPCRWSTRPSTGARGVYIGATMGSETTAAAAGSRRQSPPRSHGHAALLRLSHGRLLPALDQDAAHAQPKPRASSTSTGSARTPTASSSGPASARTCACSSGSSTAPTAAPSGRETPIGWMPHYEDIDWTGLDFPKEHFDELQAFDRAAWRAEVIGHEELFIDLHDHLPPEMIYERELLICRL